MCGRRWGKSVTLMVLASEALYGKKVGMFFPNYRYFDLMWRMLLEMFRPAIDAKVCRTNESKKLIWFPGMEGLIEAWSLDSDDPARSRDYDIALVDETGMIPGFINVWNAAIRPTLVDRHGTALFVGTPKIVAPDFPLMFKWGKSDEEKYKYWASFSGRSLDNPYLDEHARDDIENARLNMPEWQYLQEYEGIPSDVLTAFFTRDMLEQHRRAYELPHTFRGHVDIRGTNPTEHEYTLSRGSVDGVNMRSDPFSGPIQIWGQAGRPNQDHTFSMGVDVSAGVGSSNTTMVVIDDDTGQQVLEFADSRVLPERAAQIAHAIGIWVGGRDGPCIINPEANGGAGETFVQALLRGGYPNVAKRRKRGVTYSADSSRPEYGFWSDHTSKESMLSNFRSAMIEGRCQIRSDKLLEECETYQIDDHGRLVSLRVSDDPTELAGAPHGDRVIAGGLAWDASRFSLAPKPSQSPIVIRPNLPDTATDEDKALRRARMMR